MNRALGLLVFAGLVLAGFLALGLSGRREGPVDAAGTLRVGYPSNPTSLDPVTVTETVADGVARRVFNGLVRHAPDLSVVPDLAESWVVSPDGLTYTFRLREDVLFHNYRKMTAADAVWSLDRLADPAVSRKLELVEAVLGAAERRADFAKSGGGKGWKPAPLPGLSAPDNRTVVIRLARPWPLLLNQLAMSPAAVVPREEVEKRGVDFGHAPVGTGPFRVTGWLDNDHIALARFPDHFAGSPRLEGVTYRIVKDSSVRFDLYLHGDLDVCDVPVGKLAQVANLSDHRSWPMLSTVYLAVGADKPPCGASPHLRRALNYAVDRNRLCRVVLEGRCVPARGILPPGMPGHDPELAGYSFDPAAARRELELAGFPEGRGLLPIPLCYRADADGRRLVLELQQQFRRSGIPVEPRPMEQGALLKMTVSDPPALARLSWLADFPDPDNFLYVLFHSSQIGGCNRAHYSNPGADRQIEAARALPPGPERLAAYRRAERFLVEDAPWVFLYHSGAHILVKPEVRGLDRFSPLDTGVELPQADFVKVWKEAVR